MARGCRSGVNGPGFTAGVEPGFFTARGQAATEAHAKLSTAAYQFEKDRVQEVQDSADGMDETSRKKAGDLLRAMRRAPADLRTTQVEEGVDAAALAERHRIE